MNERAQPEYLPSSPYPGIDPFGYEYRNVFYARSAETEALTRLIVLYRGVLLYSNSGNGKSSLVNAGVIPRALREGYQPERIRIQPRRGKEIVIQLLGVAGGNTVHQPSIFALRKNHHRVVLSVDKFLATLRERAEVVRPLLVFDQFEEWVTLFEEAEESTAAEPARRSQEEIRDAICAPDQR